MSTTVISVELHGPFDKRESLWLERDMFLALVPGDILRVGAARDFIIVRRAFKCCSDGLLLRGAFSGEWQVSRQIPSTDK